MLRSSAARFLLSCALLATLGVACRRVARDDGSAVRVTSIAPDTVTMRPGDLIEIVIRGRGFDAADNTVTIGPATITTVPSAEQGTMIRVVVPDRVTGTGGAPPTLWVPGEYPITVSNRMGTSRPITITIKEPT